MRRPLAEFARDYGEAVDDQRERDERMRREMAKAAKSRQRFSRIR